MLGVEKVIRFRTKLLLYAAYKCLRKFRSIHFAKIAFRGRSCFSRSQLLNFQFFSYHISRNLPYVAGLHRKKLQVFNCDSHQS